MSLTEADADEPINHHGEWQESEHGQEDRAAQKSGEDLLLAEEEGKCGEEEFKAHAPEVTHDARSAGDAATSERTQVSGGGEQEHEAQEEAHRSGGVFVGAVEGVDAERENGGCSADADEKRGEIKPAYAPPAAEELDHRRSSRELPRHGIEFRQSGLRRQERCASLGALASGMRMFRSPDARNTESGRRPAVWFDLWPQVLFQKQPGVAATAFFIVSQNFDFRY
ncbi:MAG: hypothetical protein M3Y72_14130 [Acidobacteriota bacterium]|nr:hypothetical protein [Acidobacteriota bacterium]